jgi:serine/threonine-protein kinase
LSVAAAIGNGRYRIERELGRGGMATVYLAHDESLGRAVAVKVLGQHVAGDPALRERFVREARHAAMLAHPNIVQVFDTGEDEGQPYIVMECVEGETLAEVLRRRHKLPPHEVAVIGAQAAAGLAHAHAAGLVHRDVKPGNLLLRRDGAVKIADFGIARAADGTRLTEHGTLLGTAGYLAPEQAAGEDAVAASDVYALGVVLYEALAGQPPRRIETLGELARSHDEPPPAIGDVAPRTPAQLEQAVMRCLARAPEYRPTAEHLHALLTADAEPPTVLLPQRRSHSVPARGTALWLGLAAVLASIGVAVGLIATGGGHHAGARPRPRIFTPAPVSPGASAADEARNLAAWLRRYSR